MLVADVFHFVALGILQQSHSAPRTKYALAMSRTRRDSEAATTKATQYEVEKHVPEQIQLE